MYDDRPEGPRVNAAKLWAGGLATAFVAGLIIIVGVLITRGVFGIPVLAPEEAGHFGDATTGIYAMFAGLAAIAATALLHLLLVAAPSPLSFFGWIVALVTAVAAVTPFTQAAALSSQVATCVINLVCGLAIGSLLSGVGSTASDPRRSRRGP
jgi:hypothetical protein